MWNKINQGLVIEYLKKVGGSKRSKILTISNYKSNYTRTETIHQLFDSLDINYTFVSFYPKSYLSRTLLAIIKTILIGWRYDIFYIHFRAYELFIPIAIVAKLFGKKVIIDHFVSIRDTLCFDRKLFKPKSIIGKFLLWFDRLIFKYSDLILVDTQEHSDYFVNILGCPERKIAYLYVGCNTEMFKGLPMVKDDTKFRVFWYGTVLPLQGLEIILKAAKLCETKSDIEFVIVGPVYKFYNKIIDNLELKNTTFIERVKYDKLAEEICKSHLCLGGHFSTIGKAKRVIAGKSFQFIECGIPTVLGENKANRELYNESEIVHFVEMGSAEKLSNLVIKLSDE